MTPRRGPPWESRPAGRPWNWLAPLDEVAPARDGYLTCAGGWEWDSPQQVLDALRLLGFDVADTNDDTLAGITHPLAALLREYRSAGKLVSTYGPGWAGNGLYAGRIYASWQQLGADSGRMACSKPNLQNLPRDKRYRRCFMAPPGRLLVKADYSQVELRIAAKVSGNKAMLAAYQAGADLHTSPPSACWVLPRSQRSTGSSPRRSTSACSTAWGSRDSASTPRAITIST